MLPVIRTILQGGATYSAVDVFSAEHRLGELRAQVAELWQEMDVLVLPAIGTTFTVDEVLADPIGANTKLGHYTHFGNLLDLCAVVVPAGLTADGRPAASDGSRTGVGRRPGAGGGEPALHHRRC